MNDNLFFSNPTRNAASASAATSVPLPASFPVTAYSLTIACRLTVLHESFLALKLPQNTAEAGISVEILKHTTFGPLRGVLSNILVLENILAEDA
jgi:hypothetical protein